MSKRVFTILVVVLFAASVFAQSSVKMSYQAVISDAGNSADALIRNNYNALSTDGPVVSDIDGNIYETTQIGTQLWMAENLKTTKFSDGRAIPLNPCKDGMIATPGYCWFNDDSATCAQTYGALYNWYTVNTGNLCPTGWHVSTDAEWTTLTTYLGGEDVAGGKLKETGTAHWSSPNIGATSETGFAALPGGTCDYTGAFPNDGDYGYWWSATEQTATTSFFRGMDYNTSNVLRLSEMKTNYFSVRCIRD